MPAWWHSPSSARRSGRQRNRLPPTAQELGSGFRIPIHPGRNTPCLRPGGQHVTTYLHRIDIMQPIAKTRLSAYAASCLLALFVSSTANANSLPNVKAEVGPLIEKSRQLHHRRYQRCPEPRTTLQHHEHATSPADISRSTRCSSNTWSRRSIRDYRLFWYTALP